VLAVCTSEGEQTASAFGTRGPRDHLAFESKGVAAALAGRCGSWRRAARQGRCRERHGSGQRFFLTNAFEHNADRCPIGELHERADRLVALLTRSTRKAVEFRLLLTERSSVRQLYFPQPR